MDNFNVIAFTHKTLGADAVGKFHLPDDVWEARLHDVKQKLSLSEFMYLSTCNRVEFLMVSGRKDLSHDFLECFLKTFQPSWSSDELSFAVNNAMVYSGELALEHLFQVASSLDSMVVGEREIITQVRNAYERCHGTNLTGDFIRLVIKRTIETAKQVYTQTAIARNPVSVVSLAYRKLKQLNVSADARILIVGSGVTNTAMARYLKKHGFKKFAVFNRTLSNAQKLASELKGEAFALEDLKKYTTGFDVIVTCTGAAEPIITKEIYSSLVGTDKSKKIVIDLAVPNDLDAEILKSYDVNLIAVNNLQDIAKENLEQRQSELNNCHKIISQNIEEFRHILKTRKLELAMSAVPQKVKEIRELAVNEIFAKELQQLDTQSKEVLDKIISYMEKKYISVPMKMAREILLAPSNSTEGEAKNSSR